MADSKIRDAIAAAVRKAVTEMGVERFKETSFFVLRSVAAKASQKKAA